MLEDERFCSSIETESEDYWMPIQVLNAVFCTPTLSEEVQVEVVKVLSRSIILSIHSFTKSQSKTITSLIIKDIYFDLLTKV